MPSFPFVQDDSPMPRASAPWGPLPPPPPGWTWEHLMDQALEQGRKAAAAGESPVGAVVVAPDGSLLAKAGNAPVSRNDPAAHAEVLALRAAGAACGNYRLEGCVLVVTLEPCLMCAGAAVHARLAGIVYGAADAKAGALASCFNALDLPFHNHRVWHLGGIAAPACAKLLQDFFQAARQRQAKPLADSPASTLADTLSSTADTKANTADSLPNTRT